MILKPTLEAISAKLSASSTWQRPWTAWVVLVWISMVSSHGKGKKIWVWVGQGSRRGLWFIQNGSKRMCTTAKFNSSPPKIYRLRKGSRILFQPFFTGVELLNFASVFDALVNNQVQICQLRCLPPWNNSSHLFLERSLALWKMNEDEKCLGSFRDSFQPWDSTCCFFCKPKATEKLLTFESMMFLFQRWDMYGYVSFVLWMVLFAPAKLD